MCTQPTHRLTAPKWCNWNLNSFRCSLSTLITLNLTLCAFITTCQPCPCVRVCHLLIANSGEIQSDVVGHDFICWQQILFWSSPAFSVVSPSFWSLSEVKPGVNNRAHSIPHSFSKASLLKACLTSSSCLPFQTHYLSVCLPVSRHLDFKL